MDLCSRRVVKLAGLSNFDKEHCLILTASAGCVPGAVPATKVAMAPELLPADLSSNPVQLELLQTAAHFSRQIPMLSNKHMKR